MNKKEADLKHWRDRGNRLLGHLNEIMWMARRYCDGRGSYATGMYNTVARDLIDNDELFRISDGTPWARDRSGRAYDGLTEAEALLGSRIGEWKDPDNEDERIAYLRAINEELRVRLALYETPSSEGNIEGIQGMFREVFSIVEIVGVNCVFSQDGEKVFDAIRSNLLKAQPVELDFQGVEVFACAFFNYSLGQVIKLLELDDFKRLVTVSNLNVHGTMLLKRVTANAVKYYCKDFGQSSETQDTLDLI